MNSISTIKRGFNPKPWLIGGGIIVAVLGLAAGGLWYAAVQANNEYTAKIENVTSGLKDKLTTGVQNMQEINKKGDSAQTAAALTGLAESLETQLDTVPEEPNFFGMPILSPGAKATKEEVINKTRVLISRLNDSAALLTYEKSVLNPVLDVKTLQGNTATEQEVLAKAWLDLLNQLKADIQPPSAAEALHKQLVERVAAIQSALAALPDLTNKKDQAGFAAKQKELESNIAKLRELGEPLRTAYLEQDKAVAEAHTDLLRLLP